MGFMDKAKKMAEQAQSKLDEVQKQFNENQTSAPPPAQGPITECDAHGRPVASDAPAPAPPSQSAPPRAPESERSDEYAPPKLSSGDPLEG